jgi:hypothetical protein
MKTIRAALAAITLTFAGSPALANQCGYPPYPPYGCEAVCICDDRGQNCYWTFVCN